MSVKNLLFGNWFGALSSSSSKDPELTAQQKDNTYSIQSKEPKPWLLIDTILRLTQVVESDYLAKRVHKELIKMEILSAEGEVNLEPMERPGFGKRVMSNMAFIPAIKTKQTVIFLYWWSEETHRLKHLVAEKEDLEKAVIANADSADERGVPAALQLKQIKSMIAALPSARPEEPANEAPPAYQ